jgi:hypothetical protein
MMAFLRSMLGLYRSGPPGEPDPPHEHQWEFDMGPNYEVWYCVCGAKSWGLAHPETGER